ncbi:MAG TPA: MFS transporter [Rhodocyclaceae bacterium]|nr:MFS transporter [Rhodocyclaceae bacterium]
MSRRPAGRRPALAVAVALFGVTQIVAWGSLVYSIAVLAQPMAAELGLATTTIFGAFSLSLAASGLASPAVGRAIDNYGGRAVLAAGSLVGALAFVLIAFADGPWLFFAGWLLAGVAMAATLYDAAFAVLSQFAGSGYRRALTALTLLGGFASTVFWPLSWHLEGLFGWRATLLLFALLHVVVCLPIHRFALPPRTRALPPAPAEPAAAAPPDALRRTPARTFVWLAAAFTLAAFIISATAVHGVGALQASGLDDATAILAASLIGPMQVVGRIVEFVFARNVAATRVGLAAFVVMLVATLLLSLAGLSAWLAFAFAAAYGLSNGVMSIVRGTVPAELFGRDGYGTLMGRLAQPAFFAKAAAPVLVATLLAHGGTYRTMAMAFFALATLALAAYLLALRAGRRERR